MHDTLVCERMGWTYAELDETPQWFIDVLCARWQAEAEHDKREARRNKMRNKTH